MKVQETGPDLAGAKQGDEAALVSVIAAYMPLIRRLAKRAVSPGLDFDDAVQEGLIGLFCAIEHYDNSFDVRFPAYAAVCVRNGILTAKKAAGRKKHSPLNHGLPLEGAVSTPGPEEQAIASEQVSLTLERARTRLSPFEKRVLRLTLDGYSRGEIADTLGRPLKSVENAMMRARRKLQ